MNSGWWESSYSTPHLVPLVYTEPGVVPAPMLTGDVALLFSYFNSLEHFEEYLGAYSGDCVLLVGPIDGQRHCAPEPKYLQTSSWNETW